ncbi:MAG: hypothetical protein VX346_25415 [Planctomycetota bacterium]|nr:hypothetical protein [Planctomycetota bacterium]
MPDAAANLNTHTTDEVTGLAYRHCRHVINPTPGHPHHQQQTFDV